MLRIASRRAWGMLGPSNVSVDGSRALDALKKTLTCGDAIHLEFVRVSDLKRPFSAQPAYSHDEEQEQKEDVSMAANKIQPHPSHAPTPHPGTGLAAEYMLQGPTYTKQYLESVVPQHRKPKAFHDWTGLYGVRLLRSTFDFMTGYGPNMNEKKWLNRFVFLETVAGVPGMVGAGLRHMRSLRTMKRDKGWIHTLLEEAENERMHLLTFMELANPGIFFRGAVLGGPRYIHNALHHSLCDIPTPLPCLCVLFGRGGCEDIYARHFRPRLW